MLHLIDKLRGAIGDLDEDDAMLLKWQMIREFIETHNMTRKNVKEARKAARFIDEFKKFPDGSFSIDWGDPYCKKYLDSIVKGAPYLNMVGGLVTNLRYFQEKWSLSVQQNPS